jgi:hypothetical protein
MKTYRDGDDRYELIRPGEHLPGQYTGPAEGGDFAWLRPTWLERFRGKRKGKSLETANKNLRSATDYNNNTAGYIRSKHGIIEAHNEGHLLPLKAEYQKANLQLSIVQTHGAIHDELERRDRAQLEHQRRMTELKGERKSAKSRNKQAKREQRRARQAERQRSTYDRQPPPSPHNGAEAFRRHYEARQHAGDSLAEGKWRRHEIYARAEAEGRNLTEEDMLELDAIDDAARAGADEMRRTGASDLPPKEPRR